MIRQFCVSRFEVAVESHLESKNEVKNFVQYTVHAISRKTFCEHYFRSPRQIRKNYGSQKFGGNVLDLATLLYLTIIHTGF